MTDNINTPHDPITLLTDAILHTINERAPSTDYELTQAITSALRSGVISISRDALANNALMTAIEARSDVVIGNLFERSGQLVKSQSSLAIDKLVAECLMQDEERVKAWIADYVRANMDRLIIGALAQVLLATMTNTLVDYHRDLATGTSQLIQQAFAGAADRLRAGY